MRVIIKKFLGVIPTPSSYKKGEWKNSPWVKIVIVSSFWLKLDDVTVTSSLAVLSSNFFRYPDITYYLPFHKILLRWKFIIIVRKNNFIISLCGGGALKNAKDYSVTLFADLGDYSIT